MSRGFRLTLHNFSIEKVTSIQGIYRTAGVLLICLFPLALQAQLCRQWNEGVKAGELKAPLAEASGVAASRQFPGRLYHINDSGDAGNFYITDLSGGDIRTVRVDGFRPEDTEALGLGPCTGNARVSCLYIGDIGDNDRDRKSIEIILINEVRDFAKTVSPRARLHLRYPDGPHDSESMAVHPDGTIFVLTKERPAHLFKTTSKASEQVLMPVTTLDLGSPGPTDMSISDDGKRMLVLTYSDATEYTMDFKQQEKIRLNFLQQQESVTYLPGSRSFIYTTERLLPLLPQLIMKVDCGP